MECDHIKALDLARDGHWDESHHLVQHHDDKLSCLIHAWLHRVKGDAGNASYWYWRAGEEVIRTGRKISGHSTVSVAIM